MIIIYHKQENYYKNINMVKAVVPPINVFLMNGITRSDGKVITALPLLFSTEIAKEILVRVIKIAKRYSTQITVPMIARHIRNFSLIAEGVQPLIFRI